MADTIRVAVAGAMGRMGTVAREALESTGEYCCGLGRVADRERGIVDSLAEVFARNPDVLLDLTTQPGSYEISSAAVAHGLPTVVGASGWSAEQRAAVEAKARERNVGVLIVPNFSVGAALAMRFAREAARFFPDAEIVEYHHAGKKDRPSGTALETASRIERVTGKAPPIHSVRLEGLVAHQEVLFGRAGELLTIRHDSLTRDSFVAGMLAAVRAVVRRRGLAVGLDAILDELAPEAAQ
ncbi:MAG TPA: dihydrodipicolinate reductase C-terminal domain-containing protein [Candidatus Dormibacteraeota bacterium]|nr:dihydrodipicolinate reductase C-terminal domain-containing protein [Candidatus Dormibacteraeota bacterium]